MTPDVSKLATPFPADAIHWRAQSMNREGTSAMALAYIDARDVQDRLDAVCGPANWSDSYAETPKGRLICTLSLRIDGEWISKADGAGDTDVEGDKGAISDALKRAAVKWGIGRYLYDMPVTWADCESYEANGKKKWKKWTDSGLRKLAAAAGKPAGAANTPTRLTAPEPVLDDGQRSVLQTLLNQTGADAPTFFAYYEATNLNDFPATKYEHARRNLSAKLPAPEKKVA